MQLCLIMSCDMQSKATCFLVDMFFSWYAGYYITILSLNSLEEQLYCCDWMNIYEDSYITAINVAKSLLLYRHSISHVDCDVKSGTTCLIWSKTEILVISGTFRACPAGKSRDLVPETYFFCLQTILRPQKGIFTYITLLNRPNGFRDMLVSVLGGSGG